MATISHFPVRRTRPSCAVEFQEFTLHELVDAAFAIIGHQPDGAHLAEDLRSRISLAVSAWMEAHTHRVGWNEERLSTKSTAKTAEKSGRGLVVIAGSGVALDPINLHGFPNVVALRTTGRPASTLIKRDSFRVNIIGGYRFPGAPRIDLYPAPEAPAIGDDSREPRR